MLEQTNQVNQEEINMDSQDEKRIDKNEHTLIVDTLFISNFNYDVVVKEGILPIKKNKKTIHILKDIDLNIKIGSLNVILGPSGSGKTTLLNFCALRVVPNSIATGEYIVNGKDAYELRSFRRSISYVLQEDIFLAHLTVKETLMYAAKFKLPKSLSEKEKEDKVENIMQRLGLKNCENTYVGEPGITKGISGGEKKRLSIAMELLSSPSILFVDEPTTGLDSVLAYEVVKILEDIVLHDNVTVIATIHQPSSQMFRIFQNILVMKDGRIVTYIPSQQVIEYFREKGLDCDEMENPAEFVLKSCIDRNNKNKERIEEMISEHTLSSKKEIELVKSNLNLASKKNIDKPIKKKVAFFKKDKDHDERNRNQKYSKSRPNFLYIFRNLLSRVYISNFRNPHGFLAFLFMSLIFSTLVGLIFLQVGDNTIKSIQNRLGALFFILINLGMTSIQALIATFAIERSVFLKEYLGNQYRVTGYFFSKLLVLVPFSLLSPLIYITISYFMVGFQYDFGNYLKFLVCLILVCTSMLGVGLSIAAFSRTIQIALALVPVIVLPMIILCGYFINTDSIPVYLIWVHYISPFTYAFQILVTTEFSDLVFVCEPSEFINGICPTTNGQQVLSSLGIANADLALAWILLCVISAAALCLGYLILLYKSINYKRKGVL